MKIDKLIEELQDIKKRIWKHRMCYRNTRLF